MVMKLQVGAKGFLRNSEGKYLLVHRASGKYGKIRLQGRWDIVGGRINPGNTLMENLQREVGEETNLKIISEPIFIDAQDIFFHDPKDLEDKHVIRLTYTASVEGNFVLDTNENDEFKWLTIEEIKQQDDLDVYVAKILEKGLLK